MPIQPTRARDSATVNICVAVPGTLKNAILDAATACNLSISAWVAHAMHQQLYHGDTRPVPLPMPTPADVIADYLSGRQSVSPCGKVYPCEGHGLTEPLHGIDFCAVCKIRV